jgi:hypothetical protein
MANEVTVTGSLSINKPAVTNGAIGRSFTALLSNMNGQAYVEGAITVPLTALAIPLGQVTQPKNAVFFNNPTANAALTQPTKTTITNAANNGSGLVRITDTAHGYSTGDVVTVAGVTGTTEANGTWPITVITANTFDLLGTVFANGYLSGGTALLIPSIRIRNGSTGADVAQLFSGDCAIVPLLVGGTPYAIGDPSGQLLEYLIGSY